MTISFDCRLTVPSDVLVRELDGQAVLLNLDNEAYYGLDEVGTRMWNLATAASSVAAAYTTLLDEYEVEPEQLRADLTALLTQLVAHKLVQVVDGNVA